MTRDQALEIIKEKVANQNIIKHMLAAEAMMKSLAQKLEPEKAEAWGIVGLLHDGDYCDGVPVNMQGVQISKWVEERGFNLPEEVSHAMAAHNSETGVKPETKMDWAIFAGDSLTGLIVATALILPSKKLADVTIEQVLKKFKDQSFARGTRREDIKTCENLGLTLEEFVKITLEAMKNISDELGL